MASMKSNETEVVKIVALTRDVEVEVIADMSTEAVEERDTAAGAAVVVAVVLAWELVVQRNLKSTTPLSFPACGIHFHTCKISLLVSICSIDIDINGEQERCGIAFCVSSWRMAGWIARAF
jgi:hypothetical protein